ncbi:hypothetical protein [Mucilaginibacter sp.]|uniref:hypothetical protein n=1 Tax=Mucilaginibacter sp. TaxID=1882438 RepID=UPI002607CE16|nr:hypothetical protein [Mucilaginibacter sp.]MDB4925377.1 hypothetical protein [Mucilaginibacter sp.]
MKTDTYTKIVLTIIAIALTANLFKGIITPAVADSRHYVSIPLNADGTINVNVKHADGPMDVKIKDVDPYAFRNVSPIPVRSN